jgi:hypothetical protein
MRIVEDSNVDALGWSRGFADWNRSETSITRVVEAGNAYAPVAPYRSDAEASWGVGLGHVPRWQPAEPAAEVFRELLEAWLAQTFVSSSTHEIFLHPLHLQIIGLGPEGLPSILSALPEHPDRLAIALESIVRTNPAVEAEDYDELVSAWHQWAGREGLI